MDLSVSPRRHKSDAVTLISYADSQTGTKTVNKTFIKNHQRFSPKNCVTPNGSHSYAVAQAPPCVVKKSEKFLRTFRRRSKSASRFREAESVITSPKETTPNRSFGGSSFTLNHTDDESLDFDPEPASRITYVANGERARNPDKCIKRERVTLVGFTTKSTCDLLSLDSDSPTISRLNSNERRLTNSKSSSGFSTLKTSREVKMERERLRQERLQKLSQETRDWFERVKQESMESSLMSAHQKMFAATSAHMAEERARFFEEARERFHSRMTNPGGIPVSIGSNGSNTGDDFFGQFVRDNQERFSQLLQQQQQQLQQQNAAFSARSHTSVVRRGNTPPAQQQQQLDGESSDSLESNKCATTTNLNETLSSGSSITSAKPVFMHRALSRDRGRDFYNATTSTNPQPTAAEVVASLLGERGYTTRIPLKQRLVTNNLASRVNNLNNNNRTISKKDLIESNAARVHTIKVTREIEGSDTTAEQRAETPSTTTTTATTSSSTINGDKKTRKEGDDEEEEAAADDEEDDEIEREVQVERDKSAPKKSLPTTATTTTTTSATKTKSTTSESLQRSHSGSSGLSTSSSSGFSSLGGASDNSNNRLLQQQLQQQQQHINAQSKFRQLLEKKNSCEHHPSFANHFVGFGKFSNNNLNGSSSSNSSSCEGEKFTAFPSFGSFPSFTHRPLVVQLSADSVPFRVPPPTPVLLHKKTDSAEGGEDGRGGHVGSKKKMSKVTKAKSTTLAFNDDKAGADYRHPVDAAMSSGYGDSETESDEDDEVEDDYYDLDSVSVVNERHLHNNNSSLSTVNSSQGNNNNNMGPNNGSGGDADSGRGGSPSCSSPASSSSSTVISSTECVNGSSSKLVRIGGRKPGGVKPARPISAVPSELSDVSYTTSDDAGIDDDVSEESSSNTIHHHEINSVDHVERSSTVECRINEVHRIALELLSTEEQYVSVLSLIDQKFHFRVDQENRASKMFPQETLVQIFANIKPIFQFHAEFILPQLRERMDKWDLDPKYQKIGDIMVKFSHFFKMYTEYVKNFENARNTINIQYQKNSKFAAIMDEIHALPECGNLSLQQHMLTPIQRIPRYEMLLKKYLSKLPEDSTDRADSEQALQLVSAAAAHANDAMKRTEKFKKVLEVQESLGGTVDLVSPTRELIREGKIVKISARSGDHQDRYLFLFTDLLLLCSARLISNRVISRPTFRLRARFEVDNLQVLEGDNLVTANTFYIRDDHKSVELYTHTRAEKEDWLEALFQTIKELYQKKSSLRIGREMLRPLESEIGRKQPRLLKLESIQKCMDCGNAFTMMRKKHNCRACGIVVCNKCSGQKFPLAFEDSKTSRVCRACFHLLHLHAEQESASSNLSTSTKRDSVDQHDTSSMDQQADPATIIGGKDAVDAPVRPKGLLEMGRSVKIGYKSRTSLA